MPSNSFKLNGLREVIKRIRVEGSKLPDNLPAELRLDAEEILTEIKQRYVPHRSNELRNSGEVVGPTRKGNTIEVAIRFSGPHALAVHETPSSHDPPTWKGKEVQFTFGGPKYIERPLREHAPRIAERIGNRIRIG